MPNHRSTVLMLGQTPPPWHGQAVATQLLFNHDWKSMDVSCMRMAYSTELNKVGRFQFRKLFHLFDLAIKVRAFLCQHPGSILFYPPASARWIPFLRDVVFLAMVRHLARHTVFIFHASGLADFCLSNPIRRWLANLAYGHADLALEVAPEAMPPHVAFDIRSWTICPCGIEVPTPSASKATSPVLTCLFIGSLQEGKGVLEILKTAARLKDMGHESDFHFRIVGKWFSDRFRAQALSLHDQLGLDRMVEWAGELTGDAKWQAYHGADLFFFPTHYHSEASPIVIMEALGCGLPIISTHWAGIPAMLEGCRSAILLPTRSPDSYADALVKFKVSDQTRDELRECSRAHFQSRFTPERFIERVEKALLKLPG